MVKLSSMGDIIHTLPALTDAYRAFNGNISFDWVVEEGFAQIPSWHLAIDKVIPVALRRWRRNLRESLMQASWREPLQALRAQSYDMVIDAQGLIKSGVMTRLAHGPSYGYDRRSARERVAAFFYHHRFSVAKNQHAVTRTRSLLAQVFGYTLSSDRPDYGIDHQRLPASPVVARERALIFFHGTTWDNKHWPESYWCVLAELALKAGYQVLLPWGTELEAARAKRIAQAAPGSDVMPRLSLAELASLLTQVQAAVSVDTGLGHLAAALAVPTVSLFGPTDATRSAPLGHHQLPLQARFDCAPCMRRTCHYQGQSTVDPACFSQLPPALVWERLLQQIATVKAEG